MFSLPNAAVFGKMLEGFIPRTTGAPTSTVLPFPGLAVDSAAGTLYVFNKTSETWAAVGAGSGFANGSAGSPSITFTSDTNTGFYRADADTLGVAANGAQAGQWITTGQYQGAAGTAMLPAFSFVADPDTGFYRAGANTLGVATNGVAVGQWTSAGAYRGANGDAAAPAFSFLGDTNTGIYSAGADIMAFAAAGALSFQINSQGVGIISGSAAAPSLAFTEDSTTGLRRADDTGIGFSHFGGNIATLSALTFTYAPVGRSGVTPGSAILYTAAAYTTCPNLEITEVLFNMNRIVQFNGGGGAITEQRAFRINAPEYEANLAQTITHAATFYIDAAPDAGSNITLTNAYAMWIDNGITRLDGQLRLSPEVQAIGSPLSGLSLTGAANTGVNALSPDVLFSLNRTVTFTAIANVALQYAVGFLAPSYDSTGGTGLLGSAATVYINAAPASAGAGVTITDAYALFVDAGAVRFDAELRLGTFLELTEVGAPPDPPAVDKARLFTRDNGAGKTQLVVQFGSGAPVVLSTEA